MLNIWPLYLSIIGCYFTLALRIDNYWKPVTSPSNPSRLVATGGHAIYSFTKLLNYERSRELILVGNAPVLTHSQEFEDSLLKLAQNMSPDVVISAISPEIMKTSGLEASNIYIPLKSKAIITSSTWKSFSQIFYHISKQIMRIIKILFFNEPMVVIKEEILRKDDVSDILKVSDKLCSKLSLPVVAADVPWSDQVKILGLSKEDEVELEQILSVTLCDDVPFSYILPVTTMSTKAIQLISTQQFSSIITDILKMYFPSNYRALMEYRAIYIMEYIKLYSTSLNTLIIVIFV
jgi:hypothetical protein